MSMNKEISVKVGDLCQFFNFECIILTTKNINNINFSKVYFVLNTHKLSKTAPLILSSQHLIASY
jgi:hypothetical protein